MSDGATLTYQYMAASELMRTDIRYIKGDETVGAAIKKMEEWQVSSLIVERRHEHDAYAIVTRKDIVNKVFNPGYDPYQVQIKDVFTKPLITVSPGLDVRYCARLMSNLGIRRVVVFDGKKILGILSNTDIFNYEAKLLK